MLRGGLLVAIVVGAVLAIGGGPIAWAILVMIGVPFGLVVMLGAGGHAGSAVNPHFASPRSDRRR